MYIKSNSHSVATTQPCKFKNYKPATPITMTDCSVSDSECVKAAEEVEKVEREHVTLQKALDELAGEHSANSESAHQHPNAYAEPGSMDRSTGPKTPENFKNLLEKPLEPITHDIDPSRAPKKSRRIKTSPCRYSKLAMKQLQEEYQQRFHPHSRKRFEQREFMENALRRYDMEHASSTSSQSSTSQPSPKKHRCCDYAGCC